MQIKIGDIVEGKVTGITKYGAFVSLSGDANGLTGMVHISEISGGFVKEIGEFLELEQQVKAVVLNVGGDGKLALSIKQLPKPEQPEEQRPPPEAPQSFEDMLNKFKRESDEKIADLKHLEPKKGPPRRRKD